MKEKKYVSKGGLFFGSVEFSGFGGFQEKFLNELIESGIQTREVRLNAGTISGKLSPFDYYRAAKAARKCGVRMRAGKRRGLYFTLSRYKNRIGLYVGGLIFMMILTFHQSRVESILVEGAPESVVLPILAECGITEGVDVAGLSTANAEYELRLRVENIAWVDVSLIGNRVIAHIEYGDEMPEMEDNSKPRNLIASRAATIVEQTVRKGTAVLLDGSGVSKGGLLVSGTVFDGGEKMLFVRSDAEIIGEFYETKEFFVPFSETIKVADGEQTEYKSLILRDDVYPLYFGRAYVEDAVYNEEIHNLYLWGEQLPIKLRVGTYTAYREAQFVRTQTDCVNELKKQREEYEQNFYGEYEIVNCEEKFFPEEGGIRLVAEYVLHGNIAVPQEIELGEGLGR